MNVEPRIDDKFIEARGIKRSEFLEYQIKIIGFIEIKVFF